MKRTLLFLLPVVLAACASPRYSYNFDYYNYNEGRKPSLVQVNPSPLMLKEADLLADASGKIYLAETPTAVQVTKEQKRELQKQISGLSGAEQRQLKKEIKTALKTGEMQAGVKAAPEATAEMDHDLRLAIIFGAVGLTLSLFAGVNAAFWVLGVIAIVVGVVFLVRWLLRQ